MCQWNYALPPSLCGGPAIPGEGHLPGWTLVGRERGRIEPGRRSNASRNNFQEHLKITGWTSSVETNREEQIALRWKFILHI